MFKLSFLFKDKLFLAIFIANLIGISFVLIGSATEKEVEENLSKDCMEETGMLEITVLANP